MPETSQPSPPSDEPEEPIGSTTVPCPQSEALKGPNDGGKTTGNRIDLDFDPSKSSKVTKCDKIVHIQFVRTYADGKVIKRGDWATKFKYYDKVTTADGWSIDHLSTETSPDYQQGTGNGHKNGSSGDAKMADAPNSSGGDKGFYDATTNSGGWKQYKAEFATFAFCMKGPDCPKWYEGVTWEYKKTWEDARDGKSGTSKIVDNDVTSEPSTSQKEAFDLFNKDKKFLPCK